MAVRTVYALGYPNVDSFPAYRGRPDLARSNIKGLMANVAVLNGDTTASKFYLGKVPSGAILRPVPGYLEAPAIAGLTSVSLGLTDVPDGGSLTQAALLMSAVDIHLGGSFAWMSAVATADRGKRVWELLGLAADPGKLYSLLLTTGATTSAAGALFLQGDWHELGV